ncbi:MAG: hypothetical protein K8R56_06770 [Candidatus Eisenbacteria bacterium]|nr:hypothetical protein [Candidatus Eisenbacteria bacterium]
MIAAGRLHPRPQEAAHALVLATNALLPYSLSVRELGQRNALTARLEPLLDLLIQALGTPVTRPARRPHPALPRVTAPRRRATAVPRRSS